MNFIIDFYRGLDTINLIIFWGIILVVILLLVFSITIANKNKKLKEILEERKSMDNNFIDQDIKEDIPVINKNEQIEKNENLYNQENNFKEAKPFPEKNAEPPKDIIEEEKDFVAEEHIIEYNKDLFPNHKTPQNMVSDYNDTSLKNNKNKITEIPPKEPNLPYQRNVLREMSLSQTSPIGIVRPKDRNIDEYLKAKELEDSLNENNKSYTVVQNDAAKMNSSLYENTKLNSFSNEDTKPLQETKISTHNDLKTQSNILTKDNMINNITPKKDTIIEEEKPIYKEEKPQINQSITKEKPTVSSKEIKEQTTHSVNKDLYNHKSVFENLSNNNLLKPIPNHIEKNEPSNQHLNPSLSTEKTLENKTNPQEKYLKEVSEKLSQAAESEGIDRTEYEIKQEEDAIISYEELMKKKDSLQIVDEEEAVISIEELLSQKKYKDKLYNLTNEEENDEFLNELKEFRKDL